MDNSDYFGWLAPIGVWIISNYGFCFGLILFILQAVYMTMKIIKLRKDK